jgi:hypothetical protein
MRDQSVVIEDVGRRSLWRAHDLMRTMFAAAQAGSRQSCEHESAHRAIACCCLHLTGDSAQTERQTTTRGIRGAPYVYGTCSQTRAQRSCSRAAASHSDRSDCVTRSNRRRAPISSPQFQRLLLCIHHSDVLRTAAISLPRVCICRPATPRLLPYRAQCILS